MTDSPTDADPEPDWSLLPGRAVHFFGLEQGFDKKDLKRAYNSLLRRFKPEHFPAEFQKIRAAYERVEEGLRFGTLDAQLDFFAEEDPEPFGASKPRSANTSNPAFKPHDHHEDETAEFDSQTSGFDLQGAIQELTLEELSRQLRAQAVKTTQGWLVLALTTEELQRDVESDTSFIDTLIEGLVETRGDTTLLQMLFNAFREHQAIPNSDLLLRRLLPSSQGSFLHAQSYYAFTAPLWEKLITTAPFVAFAETLRQCRAEVGEVGEPGYFILLAQLARLGCYKADEAWLNEAIELLEETYYTLPPAVQSDLDHFDFLRSYRSERQRFLDGTPLRTKIDEVLQLITTGPEYEADRAFLELQTYVVDHRIEVLAAFPPESEAFLFVMHPLQWYGAEVRARLSAEERSWDEDAAFRRVTELLYRIEHRTKRTLLGRLYPYFRITYLLAAAGLLLILPAVGILVFLERWAENTGLYLIGLLVGLTACITLFVLGLRLGVASKKTRRFTRSLYRRLWRAEVVDFLVETLIPLGILRGAINRIQDRAIRKAPALQIEMSEDHGIELVSLALEFAE